VSALVAAAVLVVDPLAANRQLALAMDMGTGLAVQLAALRLVRPWFSAEVNALFERLLAMLPRRA
jgi:hypothetical protein